MDACVSPSVTDRPWTGALVGGARALGEGQMPEPPNREAGPSPILRHGSSHHPPDWTEQGLSSPLITPLITSFSSKLKPFYSTEESSELMDISIHSVISLQPSGESNESIKVGPSAPPHFLGESLEVDVNMGSDGSPPSWTTWKWSGQQSTAGSFSKRKVMRAAATDML